MKLSVNGRRNEKCQQWGKKMRRKIFIGLCSYSILRNAESKNYYDLKEDGKWMLWRSFKRIESRVVSWIDKNQPIERVKRAGFAIEDMFQCTSIDTDKKSSSSSSFPMKNRLDIPEMNLKRSFMVERVIPLMKDIFLQFTTEKNLFLHLLFGRFYRLDNRWSFHWAKFSIEQTVIFLFERWECKNLMHEEQTPKQNLLVKSVRFVF